MIEVYNYENDFSHSVYLNRLELVIGIVCSFLKAIQNFPFKEEIAQTFKPYTGQIAWHLIAKI